MREIEKTITYELLPDEVGQTYSVTLLDQISWVTKGTHWKCSKLPNRDEFTFDANYNRYYATVKYERE